LDWSSSHVVFGETGAAHAADADPRARFHAMTRGQRVAGHTRGEAAPSVANTSGTGGGDWSGTLNTTGAMSGVPQDRFPAKFSFDPTAGASCTNDFVMIGLNVAGSAGQANLIGANNLYSNPGGTGFCGGTGPNVQWAFNVGAAPITTSVTLSLDGTKVAFVMNSNPPVLGVLTLGAGGGSTTAPITPGQNGSSIQTLTAPPGTSITNSSIFVDYTNDVAYVGDDQGHLYKISPFFNGVPNLSPSWATNPLQVGSGILTSPVVDIVNGVVMVGSSDGALYGFATADGTSITNAPIQLAVASCGGGPCSQGILAPPVLDVTNKFAYAGYSEDAFDNTLAAQAQVAYTTGPLSFEAAGNVKRIPVGQANLINISKGAFSDSYFASPTNTSWAYLTCGSPDAGSGTTLYGITFDASRRFNGRFTFFPVSAGDERCSPVTEFPFPFSRSVSPSFDFILFSLPVSGTLISYELINNSVVTASVPGGTSGIIVDNSTGVSEAGSVYFTSLAADPACTGGNAICAYKKHLNDLQ
jgi:hypothetical protein